MWWNDLWPWSEVKGHRSKILFSQIAQKHWERETSLYCRRIRNHVGFHLVKWPLTLVQGYRSKMSFFGNNSKVMRDRDHSHIVLICRKSHTGFYSVKWSYHEFHRNRNLFAKFWNVMDYFILPIKWKLVTYIYLKKMSRMHLEHFATKISIDSKKFWVQKFFLDKCCMDIYISG